MTRLTSCYIIPWPGSSLWGMGTVSPLKAGPAQLAHTHTDHQVHMCLCVSGAPHTSLGLHVVQCHQVAFRVSWQSLLSLLFSITHSCLDPPKKPLCD